MKENSTSDDVLREIRDLLQIIVDGKFEEYAVGIVRRLGAKASELREAVNTAKQWDALAAMDGAHSQKEISELSGIDQAALSRFVSRLKGIDVVAEGARGPRAKLSPHELRAVRSIAP